MCNFPYIYFIFRFSLSLMCVEHRESNNIFMLKYWIFEYMLECSCYYFVHHWQTRGENPPAETAVQWFSWELFRMFVTWTFKNTFGWLLLILVCLIQKTRYQQEQIHFLSKIKRKYTCDCNWVAVASHKRAWISGV